MTPTASRTITAPVRNSSLVTMWRTQRPGEPVLAQFAVVRGTQGAVLAIPGHCMDGAGREQQETGDEEPDVHDPFRSALLRIPAIISLRMSALPARMRVQ